MGLIKLFNLIFFSQTRIRVNILSSPLKFKNVECGYHDKQSFYRGNTFSRPLLIYIFYIIS